MAETSISRKAGSAGVTGDKESAQAGAQAQEVTTPQGTLTIVLLYACLIVLMWGYMYFAMLRGGSLDAHPPYERLWIRLSVIMLIVFGIAIALSSLTFGIEIPGATRRAVATGLPADATPEQSWIRELAPGRYEVNMIARMWGFDPNEIRIPKGSTVTFYLHSQDVLHGIKIQDTTVSMMVIPGQVGQGHLHL